MLSKIFIILLAIFLSGCIERIVEIYTTEGKVVRVYVEVADEDDERIKGLMFRKNLAKNRGMLFVFDQEMNVSFWMKNTLIPLDMIFISANGTINEIKENIQPCIEDSCPVYSSLHPTKYVIEVNANFTKENGIKVGDFVNIK
ncbi:MAG: DUF192 domain-containing protein [Candidatus Micrarchaeia archaeon]